MNVFYALVALSFAYLVSARNIQVVWMAPGATPPSSVIFVNASTSIGALSLAIERVYNESILAHGTLR